MEFLIMWLMTIVASYGMNLSHELRIFKDIADAGYKFDVKKYSDLMKEVAPDSSRITLLSMLIPLLIL